MLIKNVLVQVAPNDESATTVKAALSIAETFGARLTGFFVVPDVALATATPEGGMVSPHLIEDMQKQAESEAADAEKIFRETAEGLREPPGWIRTEARGTNARLAAACVAHYADLVVAGAHRGHLSAGDAGTLYPQELVIDSGRPLFLVPPATNLDLTGVNVLVAWSESREATRAVFDALPFLEKANRVDVVTVTKDSDADAPSGGKITGVLQEHGVKAAFGTVSAEDGQSTSEALFAHAIQSGADVLVAGAYSHSRLREGLFGGVTKSIFESAPLPALLSH